MNDKDISLKTLVDEFLLYLEAVRGLSSNSILAYKNDLSHLKTILGEKTPCNDITAEDIRLCIAKLSENNFSSTSINRFISAIRTFFAYCQKFSYIKYNPSLEVHTVKTAKHMPRFLTSQEVDKLCNEPVVNELLWETRDKALFEMLYSSGCRVSEIVSLTFEHFDSELKSCVVTGKGKKDRRVFFEKDARIALKTYLDDRKKRFEKEGIKDDSHFIFVNQKGHPLTTGGVRYIFSKYTGAQGINHQISPHAMRHTFATSMLSNGADVRVVQELLGHASISTTQRYTHITTEKLIDIYKKAHPHAKEDE